MRPVLNTANFDYIGENLANPLMHRVMTWCGKKI